MPLFWLIAVACIGRVGVEPTCVRYSTLQWPPPPVIAPPEEVLGCLVEDWPGTAEPVRRSEYVPDGMLAGRLRHSVISPRALSVIRLVVSRLTVAPYAWSEMRRDLPGGQTPAPSRFLKEFLTAYRSACGRA